MAINAQLFDGTILEFPDNTDPSVIDRVAAQETAARKKPATPAEALPATAVPTATPVAPKAPPAAMPNVGGFRAPRPEPDTQTEVQKLMAKQEGKAPGQSPYKTEGAFEQAGLTADPKEALVRSIANEDQFTNPAAKAAARKNAETNIAFASNKAKQAMRSGATKEQADEIFKANVGKVEGVSVAPESYEYAKEYAFKPDATVAGDLGNLARRAGAKGFTGLEQGAGGVYRFVADMADMDAPGIDAQLERLRSKQQGLSSSELHGSLVKDTASIFENAGASIIQQLPALGGAFVLKSGQQAYALSNMFVNSFGQTYDDSRKQGLDVADSTIRGGLYGSFEALGEMAGLGHLLKGIKGVADTLPTSEVKKFFIESLKKEIPGELGTYTGQFATDKGFGLNKEAGLNEYFDGAVQTVLATLAQGGMMTGAGVAASYVGNKFSDANKASNRADLAREDALAKWEEEGIRRRPKAEQPVPGQPAQQPAPVQPTTRDAIVQQYRNMGHTKDNAEALADQDIKDKQETLNVQSAAGANAGPNNTSVSVPGVQGGNAARPDAAQTAGLEGTTLPATNVGTGERTEPSALEAARNTVTYPYVERLVAKNPNITPAEVAQTLRIPEPLAATLVEAVNTPPTESGALTIPATITTWDRQNRTGRNDEWFAGAAEANPAFEAVNGDFVPAHGMAKAATLTQAYRDLINLLQNGIDPNRTLYTAGLTARPGAGAGMGTAGGYAYREGPFIITFREGTEGQPTTDDITGILVNPANAELVPELQQMFPNLVVRDYNNVADVVEASRTQTKDAAPETNAAIQNLLGLQTADQAIQEPIQTDQNAVANEAVTEELPIQQDENTQQARQVAGQLRKLDPTNPLLQRLRSPDVMPDEIAQAQDIVNYLTPAPVEEQEAPAATADEVNQTLQSIYTPAQLKANPPVVVNSYDELPENLKEEAEKSGAKAFVDTATGTDYYVADKMTQDNIRGAIFHERGGHIGLTKLIGAFRVNVLANQIKTWAGTANDTLEHKIATEAMELANESGEKPGSARYNEEVIAYFTEIAVDKYGIDPLKSQPKEKRKVAEWLRTLWKNIAAAVKKINIDPSTLTSEDIVTLVQGASRVGTSRLEKAESKSVFTPEMLDELSAVLANSPITEKDIPKEEPKIKASKATDEAKKEGFDKPGIGKTFFETYYDEFKHDGLKDFVSAKLVEGFIPATVEMTARRVIAGLPELNLQNFVEQPMSVTKAWEDPTSAAAELSNQLTNKRLRQAKDSFREGKNILRQIYESGLISTNEYVMGAILFGDAVSKYSMAGNRVIKITKDNEALPIADTEITSDFVVKFVNLLEDGLPIKSAFETSYKAIILAPRSNIIEQDLGPSQTGWVRFTRPEDAERLKLVSSDTGTAPSPWCVGRDISYGESYLKDYNMYVYEDNGRSLLAVRTTKDTDAPYDWYGIGPGQSVLKEHETLKQTLPSYTVNSADLTRAQKIKDAYIEATDTLKNAAKGGIEASKVITEALQGYHTNTTQLGAIRTLVRYTDYSPVLKKITGLSENAFRAIGRFENTLDFDNIPFLLGEVYPQFAEVADNGIISYPEKIIAINNIPDEMLTLINDIFEDNNIRTSAQDIIKNYIANVSAFDISATYRAHLLHLLENKLDNIPDLPVEQNIEAMSRLKYWYRSQESIPATASISVDTNLDTLYVPVTITTESGHEFEIDTDILSELSLLSEALNIDRIYLHDAKKEYTRKLSEGLSKNLAEELKQITDTEAQEEVTQENLPRILASKAKKQKAKIDPILEKIKRGKKTYQDANDFMGELGSLIINRSFDEVKDVLAVAMNTSDSKVLTGLMGAMTTDQVTRLVGDSIPHLNEINAYMERMAVMRNTMLAGGAEVASDWSAFLHKNREAGETLHDLMLYTTLANVDPTLYPDFISARSNDATLVEISNNLANAQSMKEAGAYKGQYNKRIRELEHVYNEWEKLGKVAKGEGRKIYTRAKDHYKGLFNLHRLILDERIAELRIPGAANDPNTPKGRLMVEIRKTYEGAKELGVYFPLMRYGQYWLSKGKGQNKEFYMFESEFQRNLAYVKRIRDMKSAGDNRTKKEIMESGDFSIGNDLASLRDVSTESSDLLKGIFNEIDKATITDKDQLKDAVYQLYLLTMPEQSFRKQFIHRKGTTGANPDGLRNFARSIYNNANQLSRLKYGSKVMQAMSAAKDSLEGQADNTKIKHETILAEIDRRCMAEIAPVYDDSMGSSVATLTNKMAFLYLLSSPKSAINNATAIPIYAIPVMTASFGVTAPLTVTKYMRVFAQVVSTKKKADGTTTWTPFSVGAMRTVKNSPVLSAAFEEAAERGITDITRAYDLLSAGKTPSETYQGMVSRGTRATVQALGFLFHHSERLNREVVFMSAFELAYKQYLKANKLTAYSIKSKIIHEDAFNYAVNKAIDITYESMFNYSRYNRPRYMRSPVARTVLQFKLYAQQAWAYYIRNGFRMIKGIEGKPARREAAVKFIGTMMMTGVVFSGISGLFGESVAMYIAKLIRDLLHDLDDEPVPIEERDLDLWFRETYLKEILGPELGKIADKGLANYYTGMDFASGTSANNLWFRDGKTDPSLAATLENWVVANAGPGVGTGINFAKGIDDIQNGEVLNGIIKLSPHFAQGPETAYKWSKEGIITNKNVTIVEPEDVTNSMLFAKSLGYNPAELSSLQERNFRIKAVEREILAERTKLLSKYSDAVFEDNDDKLEKVEDAIDKFNDGVPQNKRITALTKQATREYFRKMIRGAEQGLVLDPDIKKEFIDMIESSEMK